MKKLTIYKTIVLICIGLFPTTDSGAQSVMLEQHVDQDTVIKNFGRNRKHFSGSFIGFGTILGDTEGDTSISMRSMRSTYLQYGAYYKLKLNEALSLVGSGSYRFTKMELNISGDQVYNRLIMNELLGEVALRVNYGKRGNYIGNYLELGCSGDWTYVNKSKIKSEPEDPDLAYKSRKLVLNNLSYLEKLNYSAHVRVGFNKWVVTADYRLSDLVNDNATFDLPPLNVGIRFDMGA